MASNKECLIVVLDVRSCAAEDFKLRSVNCIAEILKDKIVSGKKDYVSFVLVGCEATNNELNKADKTGYHHVVQRPHAELATWQLLLDYFKFVNETPCEDGEWLDALVVAMNVLKTTEGSFKCTRQRILLLFDFNHMAQSYDSYEQITQSLLKYDIELIVGTHNIAYVDNAASSQAQAIFKSSRKVSPAELMNQKHALQLVSSCNATLCNFREALSTVFKVQNQRPWTWNAPLHIGKTMGINLQGIIAMKDESHIKLKKCWGEADELVTRELHHFIKGTEINPQPEDLISGYMLGGTSVSYDEALVEKPPTHAPGLHFVGFVKRSSIPDEYYCGDSLYMLVHKRDNSTSARKLDALVRALHQTQRVMLCWKIFSVKFNTPRIVVLLPQELKDERPATLAMLELSYHAQHHFWDFPALRTERTECKPEQLKAVDKLIDSMDLECTLQDGQQPRPFRQNDLLPFEQLPSIYEQNVMDVLERKVLFHSKSDAQFNQMLQDKKFMEAYWCLPEAIEQPAKAAASELKKLFPLEYSQAWLEKLKAKDREENTPRVKQEPNEATAKETTLTYDSVGLATPAADYAQLLEHKVRPLEHTTQRDAQFQNYAAQLRVVILTLLERAKLDVALLSELLTLYRQSCLEFDSYVEYDKFAGELRSKTLAKGLRDFWLNVMVQHQLGPLVLGEATLDDELRLRAYYRVEEWAEEDQLKSEAAE